MADDGTIVIYGGSSGIGRATALLAARSGRRVRAVGRDIARLRSLADEADVEIAQADVRDPDAVTAALSGLDRIAHVVLSAGTIAMGPLLTSDLADLRAPFEERVMGAMHVVRSAVPRMREGAFLFVTGDLVDRPGAGLGSISAAATAVQSLVGTWVLELAPLRFNVLSPGVVDTPLQEKVFGAAKPDMLARLCENIPLKRVGHVDELATAALSLLDNRFINGATLHVDGGMRFST